LNVLAHYQEHMAQGKAQTATASTGVV
jgi:hypothetical protein